MGAIPILTYHSLDESGSVLSVAPASFAMQMQSLARAGVRAIGLRDALDHRASSGAWPRGAAVVTFDDGYDNFATHAVPVLARHGFGATVFVVSGHVGGMNDWAPPPPGMGRVNLMNWDAVRALPSMGIEVGAHTVTHPDLAALTPEDVEREMCESRRALQERLSAEVATFAYPYGSTGAAAAAVASRHFRGACTTSLARATGEASHLLPRIEMFYFRDTHDLAPLVAGKLDAYLALRRWGRNVKALLRA